MSGDDYCDFLFKIVLIGDCGAGKTCVVQRFKTGAFVERHGNTIGVDFSMKNVIVDGKKVKVQFDDKINCSVYLSVMSGIPNFFFFLLFVASNLGYCWSGKVPNHYTKLLQVC